MSHQQHYVPGRAESFDRSFEVWRRRCQSAMQPAAPLHARTTMGQRFMLLSAAEERQDGQSRGWGWWRSEKREAPSPSSLPVDKARSQVSDSVFSDLVASLEPEEESGKDRGQREMCERYRDQLLRTSPVVRFMIKHLSMLGCAPVDEDGNVDRIFIAKCNTMTAGGFMPSQPGEPLSRSGLLICYNSIKDKKHMEATMAHEMMHWFDHCRFKTDFTDMRHMACTEIRAASLSGDCHFGREFERAQWGFRKHHQTCVRRRAITSLAQNPDGPDRETAARIVDEVWASCFNDTRPFDEIY